MAGCRLAFAEAKICRPLEKIVAANKRWADHSVAYASLPGLVESMNVVVNGTSTSAKAGLGLFTVRAQSQEMTVSFLPT